MRPLYRILRLGTARRRGLVGAVALGAAASGSAVALAGVSAWLIARASEQPPVLHLMVAIVGVRALGAGRGLLRYLERLVAHDTSFRLLGDLRAATVRRLAQLVPTRDVGAPDALRSGDLLARFVGDVDTLMDLWARVVVPVASAAIVGTAAVVVFSLMAPLAGVVLAATLVATAVAAPALSRRSARGAGATLAPLRGRYQSELVEVLDGATELAVYGALPARLSGLAALDAEAAAAEARTATAAGVGGALATASAGVATIGALWIGAAAVIGGDLAPVNLAVLALMPLAAHEVVAGIATAAHRIPELEAAAERVVDVFDREPDVVEPAMPEPVPTGPLGVRVRALTAGWNAVEPPLAELELDLAPGTTTVVVGPSGSGKSTLAAVLLRFLEPVDGTVELVGPSGAQDLRRLAADDVRSVVGWCAQDVHVFDSTVEANLRLARPDADDMDLWAALQAAHLDEWVAQLPAGLATPVGEHGHRISGGQRQRLALARVLLAGKEIVVFDEPTEHLDDETASALARQILELGTTCAVLVLTHRPELFVGADRMLEIRDRRVVEAAVAARA